MTASPIKAELWKPVPVPGQTVQQSPDAYITSMRRHHIGLLCQQVTQFSKLRDGWDGYGGAAPSADAIHNVMDLVNALPSEWTFHLPIDGLTPTPYGTITLEWASGNDYLSVEVGDEEWSFTSEIEGYSQVSGTEIYPNVELLARVTSLLNEIFSSVIARNESAYTA